MRWRFVERNGQPQLSTLTRDERAEVQRLVFAQLPYSQKLEYCRRPEQIDGPSPAAWAAPSRLAGLIDDSERKMLTELLSILRAHHERDPTYAMVREYLLERRWLQERGCILFSQYRDSIQWLAQQLTADLPDEPIALYSGPQTSGIMQGGVWKPTARAR